MTFRSPQPFTRVPLWFVALAVLVGFQPRLVEAQDSAQSRTGTVDVVVVHDEVAFDIPDRGTATFAAAGDADYGRIRPDPGSVTPSGVAIFQFRDKNGVLITEAGVPASALVHQGRIFVEADGPIETAIAFANLHDAPADIHFYVTDTGGTRITEGSFTLEARQHLAQFLSAEPFNIESVLGTFTFASSAPVAVTALRGLTNEAGEWLATALPVAPLLPSPVSAQLSNEPILFPHFADGLGWSTQVILVNPTSQPISGTVGFFGPGREMTSPAPLTVTLSDGQTESSFEYAIPAASAQHFTTSNPSGRLSSGSVRVTPTLGNSPSGLIVFAFSSDGKIVSEAGVPSSAPATAFRIPIEASDTPNQPGSIRTGIAISNTADVETGVTLEITRPDGSGAAPRATLTLPPSGQAARMLDEIIDLPDDFSSGLLRVSAPRKIAVIALRIRINERGELKVTPTSPANEVDSATSEDRFFAHLADSDGWATRLILFSDTVGEASSGTLSLDPFPGMTDPLIVGLITKTETNPFFVKMKEAALEKAAELGVELRSFAGQFDGDSKPQIEAIEHLVATGAKGILITPSDPAALAAPVKKAREAGVLVIALDTPFDPVDSVDATFATDNFRAGELIGIWARTRMGDSAKSAKIAMLDLSEAQITVDVLRNQGFLKGFGIDVKDPKKKYDEDDVRIVGIGVALGSEEGGRTAMRDLLRQEPVIDVVYTVNEPVAAGAYEALKEFGKGNDVLIVSIDGGCPGVRNVADSVIGATAMQYPLRMAALGVEAVVEFSKTGKRPENTPGLDFYDTGVALVTEEPVPGLPSISAEQGLKECWGD